MANSTKIAIVGLMILLVVVVAKYVKTGTPINESTEPIVSANESTAAGSSGNVETEGSSVLRNRMIRATQPLTERSFLVDSSGRGSFRQDARAAGESFPGEPLKRTETTSEGYVDPDQPSPSEAAPETAGAETGGGVQSPPESNTLISKRDAAESSGVQEEAAGEGGAQETVVPPSTRTFSANPPTPAATRRTNTKVPGFPKKHTLKEGESYWTLAVKYYGKGWLHPTISKANKGTNPKKLRPGVVVIIPSPPPKAIKQVKKKIAAGPVPVKTGVGSVKPPTSIAPKPPPPGYYVVKKGDTLSAISERLLGSSRHMNKFYEVNRSLGLEYTELHVGTRLRVPKL